MDEDSDNSDINSNWQVASSPIRKNNKNNGNASSNSRIPVLKNDYASAIKQPQINVNNLTKTDNINRYASLDDEYDSTDTVDESEKNNNNEPKPPPIYIPFTADINGMIKTLAYLIPSSEFYYKSLRDGKISLMIKTIKSHLIVVTHLNDKKI